MLSGGVGEYSYVQYHWWPTTLVVTFGRAALSKEYSKAKEGTATPTSRAAGITVQATSRLVLWLTRFKGGSTNEIGPESTNACCHNHKIPRIMYKTKAVIKMTKTMRLWWNSTIPSRTGVAES